VHVKTVSLCLEYKTVWMGLFGTWLISRQEDDTVCSFELHQQDPFEVISRNIVKSFTINLPFAAGLDRHAL